MHLKQVVLFVKNVNAMTGFYSGVLGLAPIVEECTADFVVLSAGSARLALHAIPPHIASTFTIEDPPVPREDTPIKLVFAVEDVAAERARLVAAGVSMKELYSWGACDGIDPEGNVFQITQSA